LVIAVGALIAAGLPEPRHVSLDRRSE
jgi:hypothetical protein